MWKSPCLLSLPTELLLYTLSLLELRDLLRCSTVCKSIRKAIQGFSSLQYKIALELHGMVPTNSSRTWSPLSARLKLLRDRERAWESLSWKYGCSLNLPPTGSVYEFVGGFYGNGREDDRRLAPSISFFQLPSTNSHLSNKGAIKTWTHAMSNLSIIDFTMDPIQDLLVLVSAAPPKSKHMYELHLRTLSTNEPHPKALHPTLGSAPKVTDGVAPASGPFVRVQVSDDLVALLIKEFGDTIAAHLEIWNWQAGARFSCKEMRPSGIDDFCFLSRDTFLLVLPSGKFEVSTFADPRYHCSKPELKATYAFPILARGCMYWYISMSCNPPAGYLPPHQDGTLVPFAERPVFFPRRDERIHACCLYVFNPARVGDHVHSFVFFVNIRTFLRPESYGLSPCADIPWDIWGPQNTRWFSEQITTDWQHALYGYRTVDTVRVLGQREETFTKRRLRVRDYNPYAIARQLWEQEGHGEADQERGRAHVVTDESVVPARGSFEHDVVSRLPYREVVSEEIFDTTDVMMDDSRILLLKRTSNSALANIDVLLIG